MQATNRLFSSCENSFGLPNAFATNTIEAMAITGFTNTAIATLVGGASLGTAIVTVGLPSAAVAALAILLNTVALKICRQCNLINQDNTFTTLIGRHIIALATLVAVSALTASLPLFRINLLFAMAMNGLWFVIGLWHLDSQPLTDYTVGRSIWMGRLAVSVR